MVLFTIAPPVINAAHTPYRSGGCCAPLALPCYLYMYLNLKPNFAHSSFSPQSGAAVPKLFIYPKSVKFFCPKKKSPVYRSPPLIDARTRGNTGARARAQASIEHLQAFDVDSEQPVLAYLQPPALFFSVVGIQQVVYHLRGAHVKAAENDISTSF